MEKPLLVQRLHREQHSQTGLTQPSPCPLLPMGSLFHQGQRWGETLGLTVANLLLLSCDFVSKYILLCTRSKARAHNLSYCSLAVVPSSTWELINPVLTSPSITSRISSHHLKMLFITGSRGFAWRFKVAPAVGSDDIQSELGHSSRCVPLSIPQGYILLYKT